MTRACRMGFVESRHPRGELRGALWRRGCPSDYPDVHTHTHRAVVCYRTLAVLGNSQYSPSNIRVIHLPPILLSHSESSWKTACIIALFELPDVDVIFQIILPHVLTFKIIIVGGEVILWSRKKNQSTSVLFLRRKLSVILLVPKTLERLEFCRICARS